MSLHHLFPPINLKPKPPKRLLSLWNLPDYARLYGWIFHDPFTLDAYVQQFAPATNIGSTDTGAAGANEAISEAAIAEAQNAYAEEQVAKVGWLLWLQSALLLALLIVVVCAAITFWSQNLMTAGTIPNVSPAYNFFISMALGEGILFLVYLFIGYGLKQPSSGVLLGFILGLILAVLEFYQLHFTFGANSNEWVGTSLTGFNLLTGMSLGIMLNTLIWTIRRTMWGPVVERITLWMMIALICFIVIGYNRGFSLDQGLFTTVQNILLAFAAFALGMIRPLDWLYGTLALQRNPRTDTQWSAPRVTILATPHIQESLTYWMNNHWDRGVQNLSQLWQYTNMRGVVLTTLKKELLKFASSSNADVVDKVATLLDPTKNFGWTLDDMLANYLVLPSMSRKNIQQWFAETRKRAAPSRVFFASQQSTMRPLLPTWYGADIPLDDPVIASLAGFHYLRRHDPTKANQAFQQAGAKGTAKEMSDLCANLEKLVSSESWLARSEKFFTVDGRPKKPKREESWNALSELKSILDEAWLFRRCSQGSSNREPLRNSVYKRLQQLQDRKLKLEEDELIQTIARQWIAPLNTWFANPDKPEKPKAIENPFKFDQPLASSSKLWIDGDDALEELAVMIERSQPILIYGQAGMGKTTLIAQFQKLPKIKLIPPMIIDLASQNLPASPTSRQVLKMIGQEISKTSSIHPPKDHLTNYLNEFHDFLVKSCAVDPQRKFIVVLDRFEIELDEIFKEQQKAEQTPSMEEASARNSPSTPSEKKNKDSKREDIQELLQFLSNIMLHISNFRVIYVGHCLPKEMQRLLRSPAQIGLRTRKLTFLDDKATKSLLNSPLETIIARFQDEAVEYIYKLTNGQPYLVQLIAALVIQKFNARQKIKEDHPDPVFTTDKIDEVVGTQKIGEDIAFDPDTIQTLPFWKVAVPFMKRLLAPHNRLEQDSTAYEFILSVLKHDLNGFSEAQMMQAASQNYPMTLSQLQAALSDLEALDVVKKDKPKDSKEDKKEDKNPEKDKDAEKWKISMTLLSIYLQVS